MPSVCSCIRWGHQTWVRAPSSEPFPPAPPRSTATPSRQEACLWATCSTRRRRHSTRREKRRSLGLSISFPHPPLFYRAGLCLCVYFYGITRNRATQPLYTNLSPDGGSVTARCGWTGGCCLAILVWKGGSGEGL